jgi:TolB-like protein/class 3 adenylate cyclase/Tfp pilus assembly protein PilF
MPVVKRKLAAIMFADIVGYTALMQENEGQAKLIRDRFREVIERQVESYSGEVVQYYGDGALSIFPSAKESVLAAQEIQKLARQEPRVPLRVGIHLGDIVHDQDGIFGDGVNVASRIESMAVTGSVLFSDRIFHEISNHPSIQYVDLGEFTLKNVHLPVRVYAIDHASVVVPKIGDILQGKQQRRSNTIAILPFRSLTDNQHPDYFAEGVSQEIIDGLTKVEGLAVMSRATCNALLNDLEGPLAGGQKLNISHFLEGTVRRAGNRVRVSVQLISTTDGYQIWAENYDRNLDDIFEVQDEIAHKVVSALKVNFGILQKKETIVSRVTENMEAYNLHLKGLHYWKKGNPESTQKAVLKFEEALKIDPAFATAQCALSQCFSYLGSCGVLPAVDAYAKALRYAMIAIENNPNFAEGHLALANIKFYHFWDWEGARISLEKAHSLGLNSPQMHQSYGLYYAAVGRADQGIPEMLKALELDPLSVPVMSMLGTLYIFDQRYENAINVFDEILELEPSYRSSHQYKGIALSCCKNYEAALAEFEIYHEKVNKPNKALTGLILVHHALGNHAITEELISRLHERLAQEATASAEIDLALAHIGTGNYDSGLKFLESVYEKRLSVACMGMIWIMRCPFFQGLWSHEGYKRLMVKMGLN